VGRRRYPEREEGDGSGGAPGCSPQSSRVHAAQVPQLASRRRFCDADASELKTSKVPLIGGGECRRRVDGRTIDSRAGVAFPTKADFVFDWRRDWLFGSYRYRYGFEIYSRLYWTATLLWAR